MHTVSETIIAKEEIELYCSFRIAGNLYGVNIKHVKEINQELNINRVPHSSASISGLVNIRGEVYLIFNLRNCFGFPPKPIDEQHRVILFKSIDAELSGILVEEIGDVLRVPVSRLETYRSDSSKEILNRLKDPDSEEIDFRLVKGVYQLEDEIMVILNIEALVKA
ncbi:chemotaxis protein CheW [Deltaproteobacteria bacterium TL4]